MPYCSRCGVEVQNSVEHCPLCRAPIQKLEFSPADLEVLYPQNHNRQSFSLPRKLMLVWAVTTAVSISAILIVLITDLLSGAGIGWSRYAVTGIGGLWLYITPALVAYRRPWMIVLFNLLTTSALLALFDLFNGTMEWYLNLGLPLAVMAAAASYVLLVIAKALKDLRSNFAAFILIFAAVCAMGVELLVSSYFGEMKLRWSYIVLAACLPAAGLLFTYHYAIRRRFDLKKITHL